MSKNEAKTVRLGRPKVENRRETHIGVSLSNVEKDAIKECARHLGINVSEFIRYCIKQHVLNNPYLNQTYFGEAITGEKIIEPCE